MSKELEERKIIREATPLYISRVLENGGTLVIFLQAHEDLYLKQTIEQDLFNVKPDLLIIENVAPQIKDWESGVYLSDDAYHQVDVARRLNIPVVFPDVDLGELCPDSPLTSLIREEIDKFAGFASKNAFWASEMALAGVLSITALPIILRKANLETMTRKKFLKFCLGFLGVGAAITTVSRLAQKGLDNGLEKAADLILSVPGEIDQSFGSRLKVDLTQGVISLGKNKDVHFPITFGLRDAKFISTAEAASSFLQARKGIVSPKIGLTVGLAHEDCLRKGSKTKEERMISVQKAVENFLVAFKVMQKDPPSFGFPDEWTLIACATLDLLRISVSSVIGGSFDDKDQNTQVYWQGYLFLDDIILGVQRGLKDAPLLGKTYLGEMQKLSQYSL